MTSPAARTAAGLRALIRFHWRGAAALAQRNVLATLALLIVALAFVPEAPAVLGTLAIALVEPDGPRPVALIPLLLGLVLARRSLGTIRLGQGGWLRSLPIDGRQHRRAMAAALLLPLAPLIAGWSAAAVFVSLSGRPLAPGAVVGAATGIMATAAAALPVRRGWLAVPLALASVSLWTVDTWPAIGGSIVLLVLWDRVAGPVVLPHRPGERRHLAVRRIGFVVARRALGARLVAALGLGLLGVAIAWAYRSNNAMTVAEAGFGIRFSLLATAVLAAGYTADALQTRRPAWPWLRSLPTTALTRVLDDALLVALPGLLAALVALRLDWPSGLAAAALLPSISLAAVALMRRSGGRILGLAGWFFWGAAPLVLLAAAWPMTVAPLALAASPLILAWAAKSDRGQVVTSWQPLHHSAAGDTLAGTDR